MSMYFFLGYKTEPEGISPLSFPVSSFGLLKAGGQAERQHAKTQPRQVPGRAVIAARIAPLCPRNTGGNAVTTWGGLRRFVAFLGQSARIIIPNSGLDPTQSPTESAQGAVVCARTSCGRKSLQSSYSPTLSSGGKSSLIAAPIAFQ